MIVTNSARLSKDWKYTRLMFTAMSLNAVCARCSYGPRTFCGSMKTKGICAAAGFAEKSSIIRLVSIAITPHSISSNAATVNKNSRTRLHFQSI